MSNMMAVMEGPIWTAYITIVSICLILIFLTALVSIIFVLFQKSNSDGIQGITASSETFFGKHKGKSIEAKLKKWTWICLVIMAVLAITVYVVQVMVIA